MPTLPCSRRAFTAALLLSSTVLLAWPSRAQTAPGLPGSIAGRVVDAGGAAAEGVTVALFAPGFELREARTDAQGDYAFPDVPPGRYEVRFIKPGFDEAVREVVVAAGEEARTDASLEADAMAVPPEPERSDDVEEFVVIASPVAEILAASR